MAETLKNQEGISGDLQETRLLTEVDHLLAARRPDGSYDDTLLADIMTNNMTFVQEAAMPNAVTTTYYPVAEVERKDRVKHRTFVWAGRSALEVAESGYQFHPSAAGIQRVAIEVAEARRAEAELYDKVQVFISPRMTRKDAPLAVAKAEHMADDDAVRISIPVKDTSGMVIGRTMQSLLVRGIPLEAWADMLRDPNNIFGRSFDIDDQASALSVMGLFDQLDLDQAALPNGPVSLVAAVRPYIRNRAAKRLVDAQLTRFGANQSSLASEATNKAQELLSFDMALAESLAEGRATFDIRRYIISLSYHWSDEQLAVLDNHSDHGHYRMSRQLAAMLSSAKRNVLTRQAGLAVGNERLLNQLSAAKQAAFSKIQTEINRAHAMGQIQHARQLEQRFTTMTIEANLKGGGGCAGDNEVKFGIDRLDDSGNALFDDDSASANRKNWKKKKQKCVISSCPSRPKNVLCGPCGVCMDICQEMYDNGEDPMEYTPAPEAEPQPKPLPTLQFARKIIFNSEAVKKPPVKELALSPS